MGVGCHWVLCGQMWATLASEGAEGGLEIRKEDLFATGGGAFLAN